MARNQFTLTLLVSLIAGPALAETLSPETDACKASGLLALKQKFPQVKDVLIDLDSAKVMKADTTNDLHYLLPKEGGNVWQDTMAIAKGAPHPANAYAYINYICDAKVNAELMQAINYPTPNAAAKALTSDEYKNNPIIFPSAEQLKKAEPSLYLGEDAISAREEIWTAVQAA